MEIARERFQLTPGRRGGGGPGAGGGWTLASSTRYDRARPVIVLAPLLEVGPDSLPLTLQYDVVDFSGSLRILGEAGRGRFTVRFVARALERAREFPIDDRTVLLDDSVFALYVFAAWRGASAAPGTLTAVLPRALRRETLAVQAQGPGTTTLDGAASTLHLVTITGGVNRAVHVWLDRAGRLMKVEIPSRRLTAERARE